MRARKKIQQNKRKLSQQASRGLNKPPEEMLDILDVVNLLPPDGVLPDLHSLWIEVKEQLPEASDEKYDALLEWMAKEIQERLKDFSKEFRELVWPKYAATGIEALGLEEYIDQVIIGYSEAKDNLENLKALIRAAREKNWWVPSVPILGIIHINESGKISILPSAFAIAIDGIDVNRLRECAVCQRIFWAGRKNQLCCSRPCAHALRNRRYRARYKDYLVRRYERENGTLEKRESKKER